MSFDFTYGIDYNGVALHSFCHKLNLKRWIKKKERKRKKIIQIKNIWYYNVLKKIQLIIPTKI